jgi:serine/threonine protein kinase/Flp pilus assembly protein TadD
LAIKCPICHSDNPESLKFCGQCGAKLDASGTSHPPSPGDRASFTKTLEMTTDELARGTLFAGRYEIIEELGIGGMGRVYRAYDNKIEEEVALKLIRPEIAAERRVIERFRNEIKTARKIRHKNVCGMYDFHEEGKTLYLTMEYVRGEDLKSLIHRVKALTVEAAVSIARQVAEGLGEAHKLGIVHRDLKPGNIMIDEEGQAKIMDFGIARSLAGGGTTAEGAIIGTPEYMSPEQVEGKEVDPRSDIYSLGIILFEMVTGRLPFEGETPFSIANKQKNEPPPDPRKLNPQIPAVLDSVVLRLLEKAKEDRYQTTGEFLVGLAAVEAALPTGERISAKPKTSREITVKFIPKKLLIPGLVAAALIITALIVIWRAIPQKVAPPAKSAKHSIAVLPFEDLSPTKDHEYLCDGLAETLINSLNNIKDLWVPARSSSFSFEGKNLSSRQIGQQLGVQNLLEASVQVIGNRLRITPKIINVDNGSQVWSYLYDRQMEDIFSIQDEIAREIVKALKIRLLSEVAVPLVKSYTENLQAYNLYLQGRFFWSRRTAGDFTKAIDCYDQAIKLDPRYALAYVGLADCYIVLPQNLKSPTKEVIPKAKAAVSKALEIDDTLAEAHTSLASIMDLEWDYQGAEREYKQAIELNPNYATAHHWYHVNLRFRGRLDEADAEIQKAKELDPLSPVIDSCVGDMLYLKRKYDQAIQRYYKTLELSPNFSAVRQFMGKCYRQKRMFEEAMIELQKAREGSENSPFGLADIGSVYALSGERTKAIEILMKLNELSKQGYSVNYDIALIYSGLGDREKAFEWLGRACEQKEDMTDFKVDPVWDSLRSDSRFASLIKRMNLD